MSVIPSRLGALAAAAVIRRAASALGVAACVLASSCYQPAPGPLPEQPPNPLEQPLIYGVDDRVEADQSAFGSSLVALLKKSELHYLADAGADVSFANVHAACPGELFSDQPALSLCTGVLIAPDLLITAAHCLSYVSDCRDLAYVRNYAVEGDAGVPAGEDLVALECVSELVRVRTSPLAERWLDFAVLQVTPAAEPFNPPALRRTPPRAGEVLTTVGTSGGLPLKLTRGAVVAASPRRDYFDFTGDLFVGGSGSGVFDASGALLGIHVRGGTDFERTADDCYRARQVVDDGGAGTEQANTISSILDALCAMRPDVMPCALARADAASSSDPEPIDDDLQGGGTTPSDARPSSPLDPPGSFFDREFELPGSRAQAPESREPTASDSEGPTVATPLRESDGCSISKAEIGARPFNLDFALAGSGVLVVRAARRRRRCRR